ncbi:uncharacterized protein LY89DRAFT_268278 [Mollisia scopiformis]|uniref:Uncharacterized protein n=1 Tax=Mollisia scopiformis TaxID=149040 RepID=A0A132BC86_MOLSC|nr:uncharacterized protein LY89DRAFT_268278 [Mollisia scopiformis]KUJ10025.1 hypothetical protein LY89DRAFT_268278 [Mollisia scopiformis]
MPPQSTTWNFKCGHSFLEATIPEGDHENTVTSYKVCPRCEETISAEQHAKEVAMSEDEYALHIHEKHHDFLQKAGEKVDDGSDLDYYFTLTSQANDVEWAKQIIKIGYQFAFSHQPRIGTVAEDLEVKAKKLRVLVNAEDVNFEKLPTGNGKKAKQVKNEWRIRYVKVTEAKKLFDGLLMGYSEEDINMSLSLESEVRSVWAGVLGVYDPEEDELNKWLGQTGVEEEPARVSYLDEEWLSGVEEELGQISDEDEITDNRDSIKFSE